MVPDPSTFRVLPWAPHSGWMLCDLYFPDGRPMPLIDAATLSRRWSSGSAMRGYEFLAGLEVEFHIFKLDNPSLRPSDAGQPGQPGNPPAVSSADAGLSVSDRGSATTSSTRCSRFCAAISPRSSLPLRSLEVEFGPSQVEFTFPRRHRHGARRQHDSVPQRHQADRAAPRLSRHLHVPPELAQRDVERLAPAPVAARQEERQATRSSTDAELLSPVGQHWLAGLLDHAAAPPPSPRRPSTATSAIAPIRWRPTARSGAATIAAPCCACIGGAGRPRDAYREPRRRARGQPLSLYRLADRLRPRRHRRASSRRRRPPTRPTRPKRRCCRVISARRWPRCAATRCCATGFGAAFVDCYPPDQGSRDSTRFQLDVSDWEQREYFDLF